MLTPIQVKNTRKELQENYKRLGESEEVVLADHSANRWYSYNTPWRNK